MKESLVNDKLTFENTRGEINIEQWAYDSFIAAGINPNDLLPTVVPPTDNELRTWITERATKNQVKWNISTYKYYTSLLHFAGRKAAHLSMAKDLTVEK